MFAIGIERVISIFVEQILAVIAIILAIRHRLELKRQLTTLDQQRRAAEDAQKSLATQLLELTSIEESMKQQAAYMDELRTTLPTKHLGVFPDYLRHIVKLLDESTRSILICCDFPAYGSFSNYPEFFRYQQVLEEKIQQEVPLKIACLTETLRKQAADEEFSKPPEKWEVWREANAVKLKAFLKRNSPRTMLTSLSKEGFLGLLDDEDKRVLASTFKPVDVIETCSNSPLYLWLIDDNRAIFSIPSHRLRAVEHGFYTQDPDLIEGLRDIADRYMSETPAPETDD
jgi:hypothetical protein